MGDLLKRRARQHPGPDALNVRRVRAPIGLVALLSVALLVNYADRGSIAVAAPLLGGELHLSASEIGWVLGRFYWAYAPMQPVMGWCADRFGPARVLAAGFLLWSLATALPASPAASPRSSRCGC